MKKDLRREEAVVDCLLPSLCFFPAPSCVSTEGHVACNYVSSWGQGMFVGC